jgi:hypothetical protein
MTLLHIYLVAAGSFYVLVGLAYVIRPVEMAALADLELTSATAVIEMQGFYGGHTG